MLLSEDGAIVLKHVGGTSLIFICIKHCPFRCCNKLITELTPLKEILIPVFPVLIQGKETGYLPEGFVNSYRKFPLTLIVLMWRIG